MGDGEGAGGRLRYLREEGIVCALNTGMRKGELLGLRWSDVNLKERRITIRGSKTNELRTVPINEMLLQELKKLPRHLGSDFVF
ncbi:MAG: tyrosine-type recombinase/integrase [Candidatus Methylomirabilales bacterium]